LVNSISGSGPQLTVSSSGGSPDVNIDINIVPLGTGKVNIIGSLKLQNATISSLVSTSQTLSIPNVSSACGSSTDTKTIDRSRG